eukprot:PITA_23182
MKTILNNYCRVSGALINENKTEVYSWNVEQKELSDITSLLGFKGQLNWDRFKYLGLPIISGANKRTLWTEIISKFKAKIAVWGGHWLTKGGKVILIKAVLSTLPIYQTSFLLAPRNVSEQISKMLRDFLWQGGKGNENKMHLVKWEVVKKTRADGGLQIRDPSLTNLAMGGIFLWKLIHDPTHPAYRIPGNGKRTHLWKDRIMGKEPLKDKEDIVELRDWLTQARVNTIFELSKWDQRGDWIGWDFHGIPEKLIHQQTMLEDLLEEATPTNRYMNDKWGWGQTGVYTTAAGYRALQE